MSRAFEGLREQLLRGGVGPVRADRYVAELRDHLDDLVAEEREAGRSPADARAQALQRMGDTDALAAAMIARPELRSWPAKAPFLAYVVTPMALLALAIGAWLVTLVSGINWLRDRTGDRLDLAYWLGPWADGLAWFSNTMLALLLGWALAATALRQRAPAAWPVAGLVLLAAVGAALQVGVTLPRAGVPGEIELSANFNGLNALGLTSFWGRFAFDLAVTAIPYALARLWRPNLTAIG